MTNNAVLIRGLDRQLYNRVVAKAKEQGKNVAELVNEALVQYVQDGKSDPPPHNAFETRSMKFAGSASVVLGKQDILGFHEELGGPFHLENSGVLTFDKDIDREAMQRIGTIHNTGKLRVPSDVHHLELLKIGHVHGEVEKY